MKKVFLSFLVFLVLFSSFIPTRSHAFVQGAVARVVAGSTAEKIIFATAEKAGMKFATKAARDKAFDKWNMEYYNRYMKEQAENKQFYENVLARMNSATVTPIPEKPGYGKVLVDAAAFMLGVDVLFDVVEMYDLAILNNRQEQFMEDAQKALSNGSVIVDLPSVNHDHQTPFNTWNNQYYITHYDELYNANLAASYMYQIGTTFSFYYTFTAAGTSSQDYDTYTMHYSARRYYTGSYWSNPASGTRLIYLLKNSVKAAVTTSYVTPEMLPDLNIPTVLQPMKDNEVNPVSDPAPEPIADGVEVIIPIAEPYPDPATTPVPINDPLPEPSPLPEPTPEPVPDPIGDEPYDPNSPTIPSGWNPINLLMPFINFLLAVVYFLIRMADWILHIPFTPPKQIPDPYGATFEWFKNIQYGSIKPYTLMMSVANLMFGFAIYKVIRRLI